MLANVTLYVTVLSSICKQISPCHVVCPCIPYMIYPLFFLAYKEGFVNVNLMSGSAWIQIVLSALIGLVLDSDRFEFIKIDLALDSDCFQCTNWPVSGFRLF